jgi:hypothetical protein
MTSQDRGIKISLAVEDRVSSIGSRLEATPHLWGLIAILYAFVAVFALVLAFNVAYP